MFYLCNDITNRKKGGAGIFIKDSLPYKIRKYLAFNNCIVVELVFRRKKIFHIVLYRNPTNDFGFPEFSSFLSTFEDLYANILSENSCTMSFAADYNAHWQWRWGGDTNAEWTAMDNLASLIGKRCGGGGL